LRSALIALLADFMGKFAKLFDIENDEQILLVTELNDEECPCLKMITEIDGAEASVKISFNQRDKSEPFDIDKAWARCDSTLETMTLEDALKMRNDLVNALSS
jgi:hypothetical protein